MTVYTKNFHPNNDPKLKCTCGHPECDKRSIKQWALDKFQLIRDDLNQPMQVTSGGRCIYHPKEVGRSDTDHQQCTTLDIACDNEQLETKLKVLAGRHGATRVAGSWEDGFVHISFTPTERKDCPTWGYS